MGTTLIVLFEPGGRCWYTDDSALSPSVPDAKVFRENAFFLHAASSE